MDMDDMFSEPAAANVRAGGKFQPKAKQQLKREASVSIASTIPNDTKEKTVAQLSSMDELQVFQYAEIADPKDGLPSEVAASDSKGDNHSSFGMLTTEAETARLDLDPFSDLPVSATNSARAGGKFQPRAKPVSRKRASEERSSLPNSTMEKPVTSVPSASDKQSVKSMGDGLSCGDTHSNFGKSVGENADIFSGLEYLDNFLTQTSGGTESPALHACTNKDLEKRVCDDAEAPACPDYSVAQDQVTYRDSTVSEYDLDIQEAGAFADLETLDIVPEAAIASGRHNGKFQPKSKLKPKVHTGEEKFSANIPHPDAVVSIMDPPNSQFVPSETECINEGSIPAFPPDDVLDHSSMSFGGTIPPDPTNSELRTNEELTKETFNSVTAISGDDVHSEVVAEMPEKQSSRSKKRKTSTVSNLSQSRKSSSTSEENEGGKSSRHLRKRVAAPQLVDEPEDSVESPSNSAIDADKANDDEYTIEGEKDADAYDDDEYIVEGKTRKKSAPGKSKKPVTEKEKPVRKRKKANEAPPDQSTKEARKKFSHSTRRKRRCVDKDLLETPEDEIIYLPLKDILLLADYNERLAKKEAKTSKMPSTNQSTENTSRDEDSQNEEETFASESIDNKESYRVQSSSFLFNYQSYMKKEPRSRWSKQDTELFYEAVQQFGSDLSMIQQLFPDKSRHQIKLKYKKEERQQPLRLSEALANRSKDHSHFEKVIERLQQVAAQAEKERKEDESVGVTDEVEELTPETNNEETTKLEQEADAAVEGEEADVAFEDEEAEVHSGSKSDGSDDDNDIWSSYKSEF